MAFTIKIYEKNEYISGLLKKRLKSFFPDAYIVNPYFDNQDQETRFSDYERVLYDPKDISKEELSSFSVSPIRLTEDGGIIDCARFIPMIRKNAESPLLRQKRNGRRKKSINIRVCEISPILENVVYYKLTTDFTTK